MIIFKNCCFIYPLKSGCIIIAYFYILQGYFNILVAFLVQENGCPNLSRYWFLQSQIGIIAGVILLAGCFNKENVTPLFPLHIFVKLMSLIVEFMFYLLMAANGYMYIRLKIYSFVSLAVTIYFELLALSYFQMAT